MHTSLTPNTAESLNAKVGAVALAIASSMTLLLPHFTNPPAPLRILALAVAAFAAWAFCDESGLKKPLNRAGLVFLSIAVFTRLQIVLGIASQFAGRYYLLYSAFMLLAVLCWSIALLHRLHRPKAVGAAGILRVLIPIVAFVAAHLVVGFSALLGVKSMLAAAEGGSPTDLGFVNLVEHVFAFWGYVMAWLLWRGHIASTPCP
jgi:hypothetical protein